MSAERSDIVRDAHGFETPDIHSSSPEYAVRFAGPTGRWFLRVQEQATRKLLPRLSAGAAVLEAGGGHGQNLPLLTGTGARVTVLGSSVRCADLLRSYLDRHAVGFETGPLTRMPFPDRTFDVVLSYRMVTHLVDWPAHVSELCRVCKGTVLVEFPVRKGFNAFSLHFFGAKKKVEHNTRPYTLFGSEEIEAEFSRHGFSLVKRQAQFFWPMALHRLHQSAVLARGMEILPRVAGLTNHFGSPVIARFDRWGE